AVGPGQVGLGDGRLAALLVGQHDGAAAQRGGQGSAFDRGQGGAAAAGLDLTNKVCRRDPAGDDVIGQDLRQGGLVGGLDEALDRAGGQFGEGGVGRGEDGEGARARQGFRQPGGGHRGDERGVSGGGGGGVDDG